MERMEQTIPGTNGQALHHFISNSPWDAEAVMRQVARVPTRFWADTTTRCW